MPDEQLKAILYLATLAPSSDNLQPWRLVVVRSAAARARLCRCVFGQGMITEAPVIVIMLGYYFPHRSHLDAVIEQQVARGIVTPEAGATPRGRVLATSERRPDQAQRASRSTMLAAANMMIVAESLGVASALIDDFEPEKLRTAFGLPDDHALCCLIALGHAAETRQFPGRLGLADVCHEEHFGQPWALGEI